MPVRHPPAATAAAASHCCCCACCAVLRCAVLCPSPPVLQRLPTRNINRPRVLPAHQRRSRQLLSSATAILCPCRSLSHSSLTISIITNWPRRSFSPLICQRPGLSRNCHCRFMLKPTVPPLCTPAGSLHQSQPSPPTLPRQVVWLCPDNLPRPFTRRRPCIDRLASTAS